MSRYLNSTSKDCKFVYSLSEPDCESSENISFIWSSTESSRKRPNISEQYCTGLQGRNRSIQDPSIQETGTDCIHQKPSVTVVGQSGQWSICSPACGDFHVHCFCTSTWAQWVSQSSEASSVGLIQLEQSLVALTDSAQHPALSILNYTYLDSQVLTWLALGDTRRELYKCLATLHFICSNRHVTKGLYPMSTTLVKSSTEHSIQRRE